MNTAKKIEVEPDYNYLKKAIWLYFLLWIFEGGLRKWIFPSLATPLLIVRDPIAIYIILSAFYLNVKFMNPFIVASAVFTLLSLAITLTFGHGNLFVGIYGARIMLLHFPLIFIIGAILTKEDVLKIGRAFLLINLLMTIIVYFQFSSPQSAFINTGIGGEGSAGFSGAMGYSRPSGLFSFTTGLSVFFSAVSVFVFYFSLSKDSCSKILLYSSTIALIIALPLTISRGAVVAVALVGFFAVIASATTSEMLIKIVITSFTFFIFIVILQTYTTIFNLGTEVFMDRVDTVNKFSGGGIEKSIFLRMYTEFIGPFVTLLNEPLFAGNLGMGTNAGAQMLSGKVHFLVSENEFGRLAGEQGVIFGGGLMILRMLLAFSIVVKAWKLPQQDRLLPFIMCGAAVPSIVQGQWAQPSVLGYGIIITGLVLASLKKKDNSVLKANL